MVGDLDQSVGYVLKQAAVALRAAMDTGLRPLRLTVPQYSCLEVIGQRPGLSNSELARSVFVTRQAMNGVLRGLQDRDLVTRPERAPHGRIRPTELTAAGRTLLTAASTVVRGVEQAMLDPLSTAARRRLHTDLLACLAGLDPMAPGQAPDEQL